MSRASTIGTPAHRAQGGPATALGVVYVIASYLLGRGVDAVLSVFCLAADGFKGAGDAVHAAIAVRGFQAFECQLGDGGYFGESALRETVHAGDGGSQAWTS